jgi:hypothetical protein
MEMVRMHKQISFKILYFILPASAVIKYFTVFLGLCLYLYLEFTDWESDYAKYDSLLTFQINRHKNTYSEVLRLFRGIAE